MVESINLESKNYIKISVIKIEDFLDKYNDVKIVEDKFDNKLRCLRTN